jgi:hypothetical protein
MRTMMNDTPFYKLLLVEGRQRKLRELVGLATQDRTPAQARAITAAAEAILLDIDDLEMRIHAGDEAAPSGLDYRDDIAINVPIIRYLTTTNRPATEDELTYELIRGRFRGYKDGRMLAVRVGRCIRAYTVGRPSISPKLKVVGDLVGLAEWPDSQFSPAGNVAY